MTRRDKRVDAGHENLKIKRDGRDGARGGGRECAVVDVKVGGKKLMDAVLGIAGQWMRRGQPAAREPSIQRLCPHADRRVEAARGSAGGGQRRREAGGGDVDGLGGSQIDRSRGQIYKRAADTFRDWDDGGRRRPSIADELSDEGNENERTDALCMNEQRGLEGIEIDEGIERLAPVENLPAIDGAMRRSEGRQTPRWYPVLDTNAEHHVCFRSTIQKSSAEEVECIVDHEEYERSRSPSAAARSVGSSKHLPPIVLLGPMAQTWRVLKTSRSLHKPLPRLTGRRRNLDHVLVRATPRWVLEAPAAPAWATWNGYRLLVTA
ncbi:hypothetical protein R3P38DRAFT_3366090 [Favolaschia claudopus]|uniref:Uncharacterized protein n=1 Tax=Favolaschia claudopus TaxID=2862362 RepID=A0AAW0AEE7_9AGAR